MMKTARADQPAVNCAIDYFPDSFSTAGQSLMGLQSANEGFLKAFLRYGNFGSSIAHVRTAQEAARFQHLASEICGAGQPIHHLFPDDQAGLARAGALLHPFPGFGPLAWTRQFGGAASYSLLGITHTTASHLVMDSIGNLAIAPIQSWDAVVCTSRAVRATYETVLELWDDYLRHRLGATHLPRPQLPIIPLGVDTCGVTPATPESRQRWRQRLSCSEDAFVVLWMGRFNHAAKAHPIPMFLALEQLAQTLDQPVVYLQAGWFPNDTTRDAFMDAARRWAPRVKHLFVDGRSAEVREQIWHAADVFCSLSDNLQETFGLTPIEAMAAGLPVVVSDWNGYRDTVRHGIDGFLIPTSMPAAGTASGDAFAHGTCAQTISFGHYCAVTAQTVAVDLVETVKALETLARSPELRRRMAVVGRDHACGQFSWEVVIGEYRSLLIELGERRRAAADHHPELVQAPVHPAPLRGDPYAVFASYPTATITVDSDLKLSPEWSGLSAAEQGKRLQALQDDCLHSFARGWRLSYEETFRLLTLIAQDQVLTIDSAARQLHIDPSQSKFRLLMGTVNWLIKLGILHGQHLGRL